VFNAGDEETQVEDTAIRYSVDRSASTFTVRAFVTGMFSAFGHSPVIAIRKYQGIIDFDPEQPAESKVNIAIQASSLSLISESSERDRREIESRMREEVLKSDQYPEILYDCIRVSPSRTSEGQYWAALDGDLTFRGLTRGEVVSTRVNLDNNGIRAFGDFFISQSAYGIPPVTGIGGAIRLKDELKFSFNIMARKDA
jgi:polyisoprenoid-binding protein YceI